MALPNLKDQNIQDTYQRVVQTDGTKVYDGTGSLLPIEFNENNVIISGTLTAQTYVVSESIINVSSGSTIFGNTLDDTHTFTGSLSLTGSIISTNLSGTNTGDQDLSNLVTNDQTASFAVTESNVVFNDITSTGDTSFGNSTVSDTHIFSGSVSIEGGLNFELGTPTLQIKSQLSNDEMQLRLVHPTNNRHFNIGQGVNTSYIDFGGNENQALTFWSYKNNLTYGTAHLKLSSSGETGFNTNTPNHTVDISGSLRSFGENAQLIVNGPATLGNDTSQVHNITGIISASAPEIHISGSLINLANEGSNIKATQFEVGQRINIDGDGDSTLGELLIHGGKEHFLTPHTQSIISADGNLSVLMGSANTLNRFFEIREGNTGGGFPTTNSGLAMSIDKLGHLTASGNISASGNIIGIVDGGTF